MHCWGFVPSSFRLIVKALAAHGITGLRERQFQLGEGEFYAVLSAKAMPGELDLGALALAAQAEEREYCQVLDPEIAAQSLVRLQQDLASVQEALSAAMQRETAEAQRVSELVASTSWRLTAPLRAFGTLLKRSS